MPVRQTKKRELDKQSGLRWLRQAPGGRTGRKEDVLIKNYVTLLPLLFVEETLAQSKDVRDAYRQAMDASDACRKTTHKDVREEAVGTINHRGTYVALMLEPSDGPSAVHRRMLEEVTSALRDCVDLTWPGE